MTLLNFLPIFVPQAIPAYCSFTTQERPFPSK